MARATGIGYPATVAPIAAADDLPRRVDALRGTLRRFGYTRAILFGSGARGTYTRAATSTWS